MAPNSPRSWLVLVVEDDDSAREALLDALDGAGHVPAGAAGLGAARRILARIVPDMILLDLDLPDGRGEALIEELATHSRLGRVPVVVVSGARDADTRSRGAEAFFRKPVRMGELLSRMVQLRERHRAAADN